VQHAASAAGVTSFITKPFFIDQLVAQIRAFLPKESTAPRLTRIAERSIQTAVDRPDRIHGVCCQPMAESDTPYHLA
jgi:DNA-binding response OmpR family regulator